MTQECFDSNCTFEQMILSLMRCNDEILDFNQFYGFKSPTSVSNVFAVGV